jgi:calcineurin-like phosphoesterase family protein
VSPGSWSALPASSISSPATTTPPPFASCPAGATVRDYAELDLDGQRLILCHYPLRAWNGQHRGALQLHGHSHGRLKPLPRQFDVGVDACEFRPIAVADLLLQRRTPRAVI